MDPLTWQVDKPYGAIETRWRLRASVHASIGAAWPHYQAMSKFLKVFTSDKESSIVLGAVQRAAAA